MASQTNHLRTLRLRLCLQGHLLRQSFHSDQYGIVSMERMPISILAIFDGGEVTPCNFENRTIIDTLREVVFHREIVRRYICKFRLRSKMVYSSRCGGSTTTAWPFT